MIKNYTSKAKDTFDRITKCLINHNVSGISWEYSKDRSGRIFALIFLLEVNENPVNFRMPARYENVEQIFIKEKKQMRKYRWRDVELTKDEKEQAYRTAWANIRDWIEAQMALIDIDLIRMEEIFLPYAVLPNGKTVYETIVHNGQFLLPAPKENNA